MGKKWEKVQDFAEKVGENGGKWGKWGVKVLEFKGVEGGEWV